METHNNYLDSRGAGYIENFDRIVKKIMNDSNIRKVIYYLTPQQIYQIITYLENQMYNPLTLIISDISDVINTIPGGKIINPSQIVSKMIFYAELANSKNVELKDILFIVNKKIISGGGAKEIASGIIMKGIKSIIDRPINKNEIDSNLKKGANERKAYEIN